MTQSEQSSPKSDVIDIAEINPIDYYNLNHVQDAFEMMLGRRNVKKTSINSFAYVLNKADETKEMIVIENDYFVPKMPNGLLLEAGKKYSPFMLLQKFQFKGSFQKALYHVMYTYMGASHHYVRIGTKYFKKIYKVDRYGITRIELILWDKMTLLEDHPSSFLEMIEKYDDFTIEPDNKSHRNVIGNNYNLYSPFGHEECTAEEYDGELGFYWIDTLLHHIFGEQIEMGMKYLKILYDQPRQALPILVLISEERSTGKTTFVDFLNILFGANMVIINPQDIGSSFNGSYADKNIIAIEESRFDNVQTTEKLKNLATQKEILVNSKHLRQYSIPFYGKLIITSNDETRFSKVDNPEIRYWVRKVPTLKGKANHQILESLKNEIPQFLHYLGTLPAVDNTKSRMVFEAEDLNTSALETVKKESRSGLHKDIEMYLESFAMENENIPEFKFCAIHIKDKFFSKDSKFELNYFNRVLKDEMKLERLKMQRFIPLETDGIYKVKTPGAPFLYKNPYYGREQESATDAEGVSEESGKESGGIDSSERKTETSERF